MPPLRIVHPMQPSGPNAEQIEYWTATAGPKWVALQAMLDEWTAHEPAARLGTMGSRSRQTQGLLAGAGPAIGAGQRHRRS